MPVPHAAQRLLGVKLSCSQSAILRQLAQFDKQVMCAFYRQPATPSLPSSEPLVVTPRTLNFSNVMVAASPPASGLLPTPPPPRQEPPGPRQELPGSIRSPLLLRSPHVPPRAALLPAGTAAGVLPLLGSQLQSNVPTAAPAATATSGPLPAGAYSQANALLTSPSRCGRLHLQLGHCTHIT